MTSAAQAFYDFSKDKATREECRRSGVGLHLHSIVTNVFDITNKMSREIHSQKMADPSNEYRWNFFDFMCGQLVRYMQHKPAYSNAKTHWPFLKNILALPAFGWNFYARQLNESFCRQSLLATEGMLPSYKFIFDEEGSMDLVYWLRVDGGYYMERIPVSLPKAGINTWGDELEALAKVLKAVGKKLKTSFERTNEYYNFYTGPANMRTKKDPKEVYKTAKVRPVSHNDAVVREKLLLKELLGDLKHRFSPEEKAMLRKYPTKACAALGLSL